MEPRWLEADALVVGAGPAGCAAAIVLAEAGLRVVIFGRAPTPYNVGESLSPGALALLDRLGLLDRFLADGHLPCYANASSWGSSSLTWHDYLRDPRGHGFHVNRPRFEAVLRERATSVGAVFFESVMSRASRIAGVWRTLEKGERPRISAHFVIDASGRAASFARSQGAKRALAWKQVALVAFARIRSSIKEAFSLVEAVPEGFWYSAPIPGGRFAVVLFTDAFLYDPRMCRDRDGFAALLTASTHTRTRLESHGAQFEDAPRFVDAGSAHLSQNHGTDWVAVGDAALMYDPISAHGLTLALRTGIDGASAVVAASEGDKTALGQYGARLNRAFEEYRQEAIRIYQSERRWPHARYWQKRHAL